MSQNPQLSGLVTGPPTAMIGLAFAFARFPLQFLSVGLDVMNRTMDALQPAVAPGLPGTPAAPGLPHAAAVPGSPDAHWRPEPIIQKSPQLSGIHTDAGSDPSTKEDRRMSCNTCGPDYCSSESNIVCPPVDGDMGLGGRCCVKVVQYTVILARSGINDNNRIIVDPTTVAFSDDMTDADFTAWVISENCEEINHKVPPGDRKYLRVAYQVFARFAEEQRDLGEEQVAALWDIARKLPAPDEGKPSTKPATRK